LHARATQQNHKLYVGIFPISAELDLSRFHAHESQIDAMQQAE